MPLGIQLLIALLIGGVIGVLIGWLLAGRRAARRMRGWKTNCASNSPSAKRNLTQIARTASANQQPRSPPRRRTRLRRKNSRRAEAASRTKLARRQGGAGKGAGGFARGVQGVERRCAETNRAGIFAAGRTDFRQISGNGQRRSGAAAGSHQNVWSSRSSSSSKLTRSVCSKARRAQSATLGEVKKQLETLAQSKPVAGAGDAAVPHGAALEPGARHAGARKPCGAWSRRRA